MNPFRRKTVVLTEPLFCYRAWNPTWNYTAAASGITYHVQNGYFPAPQPSLTVVLASTGAHYQWEPGINVARCTQRHAHDAPAAGCECGLYGVHSYQDACRRGVIHGGVVMWGRLRAHPKGVRAEFAEIIGIVGNTALARRYGVPSVTDPADLERIARDDWGAAVRPRSLCAYRLRPEVTRAWVIGSGLGMLTLTNVGVPSTVLLGWAAGYAVVVAAHVRAQM